MVSEESKDTSRSLPKWNMFVESRCSKEPLWGANVRGISVLPHGLQELC